MGKRLYVGGLAWSIRDDALRQLFAAFGTVVSATVIMDKIANRSKGYGFVEMSTDEEAASAIAGLNNTMFEERTITVNEARPMEQRDRGQRSFDRRPTGRSRDFRR